MTAGPRGRRCARGTPAAGAGLLAALLASGACAGDDERPRLEVWSHAGRAEERIALAAALDDYAAAHPELRLEITWIPEGSYHGQVQAAAVAGDLPDLLEIDGPYVALYAWQGRLRPLESLLGAATLTDLLPSLREQGTFRDRFYAAGLFDSGLGLWARADRLRAVGARLPASAEAAWSADELDAILDRLAARDDDGAVLDLKLNYEGEWFAYGFQPALRSAGGGLLSRRTPRHATSVLDGAASVAALERIRGWIRGGLVDPNLDDAAFVDGRVALSWVGHWEFPRYRRAAGDKLALLPLPDFGEGSRTGLGSWCWAIPVASAAPEPAAALLEHLLGTERVLAIAGANGAVPGTRSALARSPDYGPGGALALYAEQLLAGRGVPRPRTPAYPVVSSHFEQAFRDLRAGAEVAPRLAAAARAIDLEIEDHRGYPDVAVPEAGR